MDYVDLGPAARRMAALVANADDEELGAPTPCPSYTLGDLIEHVGGLALAFTAAANKSRPTPFSIADGSMKRHGNEVSFTARSLSFAICSPKSWFSSASRSVTVQLGASPSSLR